MLSDSTPDEGVHRPGVGGARECQDDARQDKQRVEVKRLPKVMGQPKEVQPKHRGDPHARASEEPNRTEQERDAPQGLQDL